ncbi:MAG: hypothetical protein WBL84_17570 [Xanthobacteraceae bacterium]
MTRSTPNCTPGRRRACATALIACATLSWGAPGLPSAALGQTTLSPTGTVPSSPSPQAPAAGIPQAPVGHRQPRPSDLPPDVRREENANAPQQQQERSGLEGLPTICVRC